MQILAILEHDSGGELKAAKSLLDAVTRTGSPVMYTYGAPLRRTGLLHYLFWIVTSLVQSSWLALKHRRFEVVYTTSYTAALGALIARPFTQQFICFHYHGSRIPPQEVPDTSWLQRHTQSIKHAMVSYLHRWTWSQVNLFISPSEHTQLRLAKSFPNLGRAQLILPNGVDTTFFYPVSEAYKQKLRKQFHIPKTALVCLVIARAEPQKKIEDSIAFITDIQRYSRKQVLLLLATPQIGNNPEYLVSLQQFLARTELPHLLIQDHPNTPELYQVSDCVISHSLQEVFPLVLLEASACGVPYFAKKNGAVEHYLVPLDPNLILSDDSVQAARQVLSITHKQKRAELLRQFACHHTWQASASLLLITLQKQRRNEKKSFATI